MVGVPGKYKGCETCRRRRVKCDNMRPVCRKCVSTGRHCEGYERQMIFITATPEDGGRCSSHPPRSASRKHAVKPADTSSVHSSVSSGSGSHHSSPSPSVSTGGYNYTNTANSNNNMAQQLPLPSPQISSNQSSDVPALAPSEPLRSAWDSMFFLSDKQHYYPTQVVSLQTRLAHVSRRMGNTISLPHYELPNLRTVSYDREFGVSGQCIVSVDGPNSQIQHGISNINNGLCVFLYEPNNCSASADMASWRHDDYMANVENVGPQAFSTFPAHHFFTRVYRPTNIAWSLLTRKQTHLAQREWATLPWDYYPKSLTDRLFDVLSQLPGLLECSDAAALDVPTHARQLKVQELLTHCLHLERQLSEWCDAAAVGPDETHRHSYWIDRPADAQVPFTKTFVFMEGATAVGFLFYWMGSLLLGKCILKLHRLFFQPAIDFTMYPILPAELNIDMTNYQQDRMFATNICCALDFALSAVAQPDILIGPLTVADMYFKELQITGQGQIETVWCDGLRQRIAAKGQHIARIVESRVWREYGSF